MSVCVRPCVLGGTNKFASFQNKMSYTTNGGISRIHDTLDLNIPCRSVLLLCIRPRPYTSNIQHPILHTRLLSGPREQTQQTQTASRVAAVSVCRERSLICISKGICRAVPSKYLSYRCCTARRAGGPRTERRAASALHVGFLVCFLFFSGVEGSRTSRKRETLTHSIRIHFENASTCHIRRYEGYIICRYRVLLCDITEQGDRQTVSSRRLENTAMLLLHHTSSAGGGLSILASMSSRADMAPYRLKSGSWIISFGPSADAASRHRSVTSNPMVVGGMDCPRSTGESGGGLLEGVAMYLSWFCTCRSCSTAAGGREEGAVASRRVSCLA